MARFLLAAIVHHQIAADIARGDANPGSGTTKNWFHDTYGIPAYTYEIADNADRAGTRDAARALAESLPSALELVAR
ncbi:hypothetical protein [Altererythrobacter litoralis]|uniref:Uncharacterized protein n=1 Tax=Altererythrobacter litoralis TaxID=3113904 RepID=A0ABU7GCH6_9SPHN|nr:hypothetical protein [Erythrobacteraceae bacterium 1XM1-14]